MLLREVQPRAISSTTVSDTLGDAKNENVKIIRYGYSSLILDIMPQRLWRKTELMFVEVNPKIET